MIDDNTSIYVQDDTPNNETQYRARFYLNPNSLTMAGGDILDLFTGRNASTDVVRIQLQKNGTTYQVRAGLLNDAGAWTDTSWYDVPNAWSAVEIHYQAFSNSGSLTLWLDDVQKQSLTFIDNDTRAITDVRLGAQGVDTGTNGTIYFDDFESRRFSYIGTLTDPGVDDPTATNQPGWLARTYTYSPTIPHAVTSVSPETGSPDTYEYDENGNMTAASKTAWRIPTPTMPRTALPASPNATRTVQGRSSKVGRLRMTGTESASAPPTSQGRVDRPTRPRPTSWADNSK